MSSRFPALRSGNVVVTVSGIASNGVNFTVVQPPSITSVSPTSGAVGRAVTITGSNFGNSQATSTISFNGTAAVATTWSDSQIVANVPSGATTGSIVVTVAGLTSNGAIFTVVAPPSITATVSPTPSGGVWNNSNVVVTFTCTQGSLPVASCPAPQNVSSEGFGQIITGTVTDNAGNSASTTIVVNIDRTSPVLSITSTTDGSSVSSSSLSVSGSFSDALSGASGVTCNGTAATLSGSSFSCNISLAVGVNLVAVRATDLAGNAALLKSHVTLSGSLPVPSSLQVSPSGVTMLIGDTQRFNVVDEQGRPRSDATWTVSDSSLATITADSSPVLSALASGQVTLTASVSGLAAQAQVTISGAATLPPGTVRWTSAPSAAGSYVGQVVQAQPVDGAPDLYSVEHDASNTPMVRAMSASGTQVWARQFPGAGVSVMASPDGGVIVLLGEDFGSGDKAALLDGQTGATVWEYSQPYVAYWNSFGFNALGPDLRAVGESCFGCPNAPKLYAGGKIIDAATGSAQPFPEFPKGSIKYLASDGTLVPIKDNGGGFLNGFSVGSDGTVYGVSSAQNWIFTGNQAIDPPFTFKQTVSLATIGKDGSVSSTPFELDTSLIPSGYTLLEVVCCGNPIRVEGTVPSFSVSKVVPDGQGGAFATWQTVNGSLATEYHLSHILPGSGMQADYVIPIDGRTVVLGENGIVFLSNALPFSPGRTAMAIDSSTGQTLWTYPAQSTNGVLVVAALGDGSAVLNDYQVGMVQIDPTGNATTYQGTANNYSVTPWGLGNWIGDLTSTNDVLAEFVGPSTDMASSSWPLQAGNFQGAEQSPKLLVSTFMARVPGVPNTQPWGTEDSARTQLTTSILRAGADGRFYGLTNPNGKTPIASAGAFLNENKDPKVTIVGFIGDSRIVSDPSSGMRFSQGLIFKDRDLIRTPNCDDMSLGICYNLDTTGVPSNPPCTAGQAPADGLCYNVLPPCRDGAVLIGSYCFRFYVNPETNLPSLQVKELATTAKVVFIASCQTTSVFTKWWNLDLNPVPGGRALVVPNIGAMAALNANNGTPPQNQGSVDLVQGSIAFETFTKTLATPGKNVQNAVDAANAEIARQYPTLTWDPQVGQLPQVVYTVIGKTSVCPTGTCGGAQ